MSEYLPDNWVVLKINHEGETLYKVLAGWRCVVLAGGAGWRMNSGIVSVETFGDLYGFYGFTFGDLYGFYGLSGSVYWCRQGAYGLTMATSGIYNKLKERVGDAVELMPEDTDWMAVEW